MSYPRAPEAPGSISAAEPARFGPPSLVVLLTSATCVAVFALLTALVQMHVLRPLDHEVALRAFALDVPIFEWTSAAIATVLAFEASTAYAIVASVLLWRGGAGRWSVAPFAFFGLTAVELLLKLTLDQPGVPSELQRQATYPFTVMTLAGSFPSGHAIRSAFFCVFVAVLTWRRGQHSVLAIGLVLLSVPLALTRVYMGYHWLSDVVAGLVLGAGVALLLATAVAQRLWPTP